MYIFHPRNGVDQIVRHGISKRRSGSLNKMQLEEITHVLTSFFDLHLTQYMIRKQIYMTD